MPIAPRVYVVHEVPQNDLTPAQNFGEIAYINKRYIYGDEIEEGIPEAHRIKIVEAVRRFRPDYDYVLIAGDHLQIVVFCAYLARAHRRFRVLRYDRQQKGYLPVEVDAR